jgi:16S rRNA (adenine1518-N6/adenine1519-N6)-dimethyltransferase
MDCVFPPLDYDSVSRIKAVLSSRGLAMQKKFSQNFLIHAGARETLIDALKIDGGSEVWEIGPGLGAMSFSILAAGARLTAFELDRGFCDFLREVFERETEQGNFVLVPGDALKTLPLRAEAMLRGKTGGACFGSVLPVTLFGNLPYGIASLLVARAIESGLRFSRIVATVQKEVAERMTAEPGTKNYSSFSVLCSWAYRAKKIADFPGAFFWPRPDVDSRALVLSSKEDFPRCKEPRAFTRVTRAAFSSRRKTLKNNLSALFGSRVDEILERCAISPAERAENISADDFARLSDAASEALPGFADYSSNSTSPEAASSP